MATSTARPLPILVRHFFSRIFDRDSISPQGEPEAGLAQILGLLATPAAFFVLLFRLAYLSGWYLVTVRCYFICFSMILMGFLMVFTWNDLLPDRRDYLILTPLPLRSRTVLLAKMLSLGMLFAVFLTAINFFGIIFWPGLDARPTLFNVITSHMLSVIAAGLFAAFALGALQGVIMTVFRGSALRTASLVVQTLFMGLLVLLLFVTPILGQMLPGLIKSGNPWVYAFPGYWFVGLYEHLRPATRNPVLLDLGRFGFQALIISIAVFFLTYLPGYQRHARAALESPQPSPKGPGLLRRAFSSFANRLLLRSPVERAVFHFIGGTITRSSKHRLFLAAYGGLGAALGVSTFVNGKAGLLELPLTLSFILVSGLRAAFNFPAELRANWAFQLSETDQPQLYLRATRKWVFLCAIVPLFVLLAPMEFTFFPAATAGFHLAYGVTLSVLLMDIMFAGFRKVPFTCAYFPGKVNLTGLTAIYCLGFTAYSSVMAKLEGWLTGDPTSAAAFFLTAWSLSALLVYGLRTRAALDYDNAPDPAVRTLGLSGVPHE